MEALSYFLLGLVQGLTEFLPVSSSGHLVLGQTILRLEEEDLSFSVLVHAATALSTLVVFRKDIGSLFRDVFRKDDAGSEARKYGWLLVCSAIPAAIVGLGFKDAIETLATPRFVGAMLCVTAGIFIPVPSQSKRVKSTQYWPRFGHWFGTSLRNSSRNKPLRSHHLCCPHSWNFARGSCKVFILDGSHTHRWGHDTHLE